MSRTHPQQRVQKKSDRTTTKKDFSKDLSTLYEPKKPVKFSREDVVVKKEMVELNVEVPEKVEEPKQIKKKK